MGKPKANRCPLFRWQAKIALVGIEACPLSEWLYGALVESGLHAVCIETRHAQRLLSSRPNKTDRSDARGIADMMRLGHFRAVHVKSKESQLLGVLSASFAPRRHHGTPPHLVRLEGVALIG
jgi:transposase